MFNPLNYGTAEWIQSHWFKRFSEEPESEVVIAGCRQSRKALLSEDFLSLLSITKEPVFTKDGSLVGRWENKGAVPRPKSGRFCERWNEVLKQFDTWVFETMKGAR